MDLKHPSAQIWCHSESYSRGQRALQDWLLPCQHSSIEKLFNALALIGPTCIVIAHLKTDTSTRGMDGWKSSLLLMEIGSPAQLLLPMTNDPFWRVMWHHDSTWVSTWSLVQKHFHLNGTILREGGIITHKNALMDGCQYNTVQTETFLEVFLWGGMESLLSLLALG